MNLFTTCTAEHRRQFIAVAMMWAGCLLMAATDAAAQNPASENLPRTLEIPGTLRRGTRADAVRFVGDPSLGRPAKIEAGQPVARVAQLPDQLFERSLEQQAIQTDGIPGLKPSVSPSDQIAPANRAAPGDRLIPTELQRLALPQKAVELSQLPEPTAEVEAKFGEYVEPPLEPEKVLYVIQGRPKLLPLNVAPSRIQVGDERIANYQLITPKELQIFGLAEGQTVLNLWFKDDPNSDEMVLLSYIIQVVDDYRPGATRQKIFDRLAEDINRTIPRARIRLTLVGTRVVISGDVPDQFTAQQILQIVAGAINNRQQNLDANNVRVVVGVDGDLETAPEQLADILGGNGRRGQNNANIINMLRIIGEQQIQLRVTLAEVNRSALRAIGADFNLDIGSGLSFASLLPDNVNTLTPGGGLTSQRGDLSLAVSAIRTLGLSRTLAEPNLVTLNGQTATFRSGTELAVNNFAGGQGVVLQAFDQVFAGILLNFTPEIIDRDRIRVTINATSSSVAGTSAAGPNISTNNVSTVIELREHQTMAIAGLVQNTFDASTEATPLLGDLPVLRRLFSNDSTNYNERELLIVVTPSLVTALEEHEVPSLPGETITEPSDLEFYVGGRLEGRRDYDYRSTARTSWARMKAYHHCEQCVLIGPSGHTDGPLDVARTPDHDPVQRSGRERLDQMEFMSTAAGVTLSDSSSGVGPMSPPAYTLPPGQNVGPSNPFTDELPSQNAPAVGLEFQDVE